MLGFALTMYISCCLCQLHWVANANAISRGIWAKESSLLHNGLSVQQLKMKYCKRRNFRTVYIFALLKCPRKYVQRENNFYYAIKRPYCQKREYKSTRNCQFSQIRENLYTGKYLHSQHALILATAQNDHKNLIIIVPPWILLYAIQITTDRHCCH